MKKLIYSFLFLIIVTENTIAQNKQEIITNMIEEVTYLASDKLEGRATGTLSEKMAAEYIRSRFQKYNIGPKGEDGYFQYFEAKIKEMTLKYGTQLDTTKLKADAELDKMIVSNNSKILEEAQKSANMLGKQIQGIDEPQRQSQEKPRIEQSISGETDITE